MQYNYTMNQPYGNAGYSDQYYPPQDPYQQNYAQGSYEEDDYDNLDEIERVNTELQFLFYFTLSHQPSPTTFGRSLTWANRMITREKWLRLKVWQ